MSMSATLSVGSKIREHRKAQRLTLVQMAEGCDISPSFLSQIERGQASPSVTTLYTIAATLDIPVAAFFSVPEEPEITENPSQIANDVRVVRKGLRKGLLYPDSGIFCELLSPDLQRDLQMMWIVMPPGSDSGDTPFIHEGEECGVILQGKLETTVDGKRFVLGPGDSIYHDSTLPHSNRVLGDEEVIMVVAKTPPSF